MKKICPSCREPYEAEAGDGCALLTRHARRDVPTDDEAEIKYVRKRLYVTEKAPAISVDSEGYVRVGLSANMSEHDMLVLGLVLSLRNKEFKSALVKRVEKLMEGATTPTSRIARSFDLLKQPD